MEVALPFFRKDLKSNICFRFLQICFSSVVTQCTYTQFTIASGLPNVVLIQQCSQSGAWSSRVAFSKPFCFVLRERDRLFARGAAFTTLLATTIIVFVLCTGCTNICMENAPISHNSFSCEPCKKSHPAQAHKQL